MDKLGTSRLILRRHIPRASPPVSLLVWLSTFLCLFPCEQSLTGITSLAFKGFGKIFRTIFNKNGAAAANIHKPTPTEHLPSFVQVTSLPMEIARLPESSLATASVSELATEGEEWIHVGEAC